MISISFTTPEIKKYENIKGTAPITMTNQLPRVPLAGLMSYERGQMFQHFHICE